MSLRERARGVRDALRAIRLCRNWPEIVRAAAGGPPCSRFVLRNGVDLRFPAELDTNLTIFDEIFVERFYTRHFDVRSGDTVVDVGANVGIFAAYAAVQGCDRVICVEPLPANVAAIKQNAERNGFANIAVDEAAVAGERGTARLYVTDEDSGGNLLFDHNEAGPIEDFVEVPTVTLTDLYERHGLERIDFLKMDCEGGEGLVFANLEPEDLSRVDRVAMEFHDGVSPVGHEEIVRRLHDAGFRTRTQAEGGSAFGYIWAQRASG